MHSPHSIITKRPLRTSIDRDVRRAKSRQDASRVGGCTGQGGIAVDGANAEEAEAGVLCCDEDGEGVLGDAASVWGAITTSGGGGGIVHRALAKR
jgi:hypothetical protein